MLASLRLSRKSVGIIMQSRVSVQFRNFASDGSHDDFKPKRKTIPTEMDDVIKLIESQVKENPVMLFMKGDFLVIYR